VLLYAGRLRAPSVDRQRVACGTEEEEADADADRASERVGGRRPYVEYYYCTSTSG
jgi:hypothetical protein